jgi:hypothetical protein
LHGRRISSKLKLGRGISQNRAVENGMSADPAELIFFQQMTPEKFFQEADRLGIGQDQLRDPGIRDRVFHDSLIAHRAETAKAVADNLHLPITDEQARSIARNSLVPEVLDKPAPLNADERRIAAELYYHAILAAAARHGVAVTEESARNDALRMIRFGERGLTAIQKFSRSAGCLVMLGLFGMGGGLAVLSAVLLAATV